MSIAIFLSVEGNSPYLKDFFKTQLPLRLSENRSDFVYSTSRDSVDECIEIPQEELLCDYDTTLYPKMQGANSKLRSQEVIHMPL